MGRGGPRWLDGMPNSTSHASASGCSCGSSVAIDWSIRNANQPRAGASSSCKAQAAAFCDHAPILPALAVSGVGGMAGKTGAVDGDPVCCRRLTVRSAASAALSFGRRDSTGQHAQSHTQRTSVLRPRCRSAPASASARCNAPRAAGTSGACSCRAYIICTSTLLHRIVYFSHMNCTDSHDTVWCGTATQMNRRTLGYRGSIME